MDQLLSELKKLDVPKPIVLLATKIDLRDSTTPCVPQASFAQVKETNGLIGTFETSAKDWSNFSVQTAIKESVKIAIDAKFNS